MDVYRAAFKVMLAAGVTAVIFLLLWYAIKVLLVVFAGTLFGIFLRGLGDLLSDHTPISRRWSLVIVILGLVGLTYLTVDYTWPRIAGEIDKFIKDVPGWFRSTTAYLDQYAWGRWLLARAPELETALLEKVSFAGLLTAILDAIVAVIIAIFIGVYLSAQSNIYVRGLVNLTPESKRAPARQTVEELGATLRWWMIGQSVSMLTVGVLDFIGLALIGVPLAGTLGIISGLLTFIPYFGSLIALIPSVLVAATVSANLAFWAAVVHFIGQSIEAYFVTPLVQRRAVRLPPVLTIGSQFLLGAWAGVLGVLFATPLAAMALFLVRKFYLGEDRFRNRT